MLGLNKRDVALRQVRTAIRLFILGEDLVSIHTLAAAAHQVLRDLLKPAGEGSILKDNDRIRPERRKEFAQKINEAENFAKHAERDRDAVLDFNPELTHHFLLDCILMYERLTGRKIKEGIIFAGWYMVRYPETLLDPALKNLAEKVRTQAGAAVGDPKLLAPFLEYDFGDTD